MARHSRWQGRIDLMLRKGWLGGVMLGYGEAWETLGGLRGHVEALRGASKYPLLVSLPQDNGVGEYLRPGGGAILPRAPDVPHKTPRYLRARQRFICEEARLAGVDLVGWVYLDVARTPGCEIADIAYATDQKSVTRLALAAYQGVCDANMAACGCHFVGLGATAVPSHVGDIVPQVTLDDLQRDHLMPWMELFERGLPAVMTAHTWIDGLEPERGRPATLSRACLDGWLRGDLGFGGCVIADSLSMAAIRRHYTAVEAAVEALCAGCDLLLCDWNVDPLRLLSGISAAAQAGDLSRARLYDAAGRVIELKRKAGLIG